MTDRNLDGVYFRVKRAGNWETVAFSDLSENDMRLMLRDKPQEWLINLCVILGTTLKNIGDKFDLEAKSD